MVRLFDGHQALGRYRDGSLGIISEALHSGLDLMAAAMTFYAVKVAARPADESHPYGHEKVENLSALAETALLLITCAWIVWEAVDRLFYNEAEITLTWWAFAVVAVSLLVDVNRSAMLRPGGQEAQEPGAGSGRPSFYHGYLVFRRRAAGPFLRMAGAPGSRRFRLARLAGEGGRHRNPVCGGLVCSVAFGLAKRSIHALMDGGSSALTQQVLTAMKKNAPDYPVKRIRLRDGGARIFVELDVEAPRSCTWTTPMMWRSPSKALSSTSCRKRT